MYFYVYLQIELKSIDNCGQIGTDQTTVDLSNKTEILYTMYEK